MGRCGDADPGDRLRAGGGRLGLPARRARRLLAHRHIALARLLKRPPVAARCWLGFTTQVTSRRPYPRLAVLWDMVARSAYTQLRYSPALLALVVAGLAWLYLLPPVAGLAGLAGLAAGTGSGAAWCAATGLAGWALMTARYVPVLRLYRLSPVRAPGLPLAAFLYAAMTVDSARRHYAGRCTGAVVNGRAARSRQPRAPGDPVIRCSG
jgi:hypothetical protein